MKNQALIVDSSLTARMDLRSVLSAAGFAVTACETLALAWKMLRDKAFSVVVLDRVLRDGNGLDFLGRLRSTPELASTPVILLAAEAAAHRIRGVSVRADDYVPKPYDRSQLADRASRLVARKRTEIEELSSARTGSLLGKKLLVVDDSPTYLEMLGQLLRLNGCRVTLVHSGEEALKLLAMEPFDCVIMDLLMPGMGGMAAAEQIKRTPALADTPVVILTGLEDFEVRARGAAVGVDEFVRKLPDVPLLTTRLRGLFRKKAEAEGRSRPASHHGGNSGARATVAWRDPDRVDEDCDNPSQGTNSLITKVIAASGLSSAIGPSTIFRTCKRAGIDPMSISPQELQRALPALQQALRFLLTEEEWRRSVAALAMLAQPSAA